VADHQVIFPWRWSAVLKGTDLFIGAADADVQHSQGDLVRLGDPGNFLLDDPDLTGSRKDRNCFHVLRPFLADAADMARGR
jgi:hypothetical protein